jgi:hypothetical protein
MTSERRLAANRANGKKSRGPASLSGKRRSSLNALKHGLSVIHRDHPKFCDQIEEVATKLCAGENHPRLVEYAMLIAEAQVWLQSIQNEELALIERLRDPLAVPLKPRAALIQAEAHLEMMKPAILEFKELERRLYGEDPSPEKHNERQVPASPAGSWKPPVERNQFEAMTAALRDLRRLQRYKRQAWAQYKRAIKTFLDLREALAVIGSPSRTDQER